MPPPVPPSVNEGRITAGRPTTSSAFSAWVNASGESSITALLLSS